MRGRRWAAVVAGVAVALVALAAPASAAKGGNGNGSGSANQTVDGTYSGTAKIEWLGCHWAGTAQGFGGTDWQWTSILNDVTAGVRAGTLGRGTTAFSDDVFNSQTPGPWTFTAQDGKSNLTGLANGRFVPAPQTLVFDVSVTGGNGKFAGVSGGALTIFPDRVWSVCDGLNFNSFQPNGGDPSQPWPPGATLDSPVIPHATNASLVGYLTYG